MKSNQIILFLIVMFFCLHGYAKRPDSTQCIILSHTSKNRTIKFENYEYIIVWVNNGNGLQQYEGLLNIQNDSIIQIKSETIALHEIIGFKKKSFRQKKVGKGFIIGGLTTATLGGIGFYVINHAEANTLGGFLYQILGVFVTGGMVLAGIIYTFVGVAIRESSESQKYTDDYYEAKIKWVKH
ncbi:hypothetical protein DNU06_10830 [Putridiphycobacter roseus]|uniref:Uncharacterized protein n=1 Tax=Putridiphycobacter roseus TaxID=2219161 RepID=A0A2W1NFF2_9FLAO|nr:hypothetical protein [Putridiphycobacter roseus]PZE16746.1 hypothetical protein DNU06_10830 [Putridiphycobacter roseus]